MPTELRKTRIHTITGALSCAARLEVSALPETLPKEKDSSREKCLTYRGGVDGGENFVNRRNGIGEKLSFYKSTI